MNRKLLIITVLLITSFALVLTACGNNVNTSDVNTYNNETSKVKTVKIAYLPLTHALPLFVENELSQQGFKNIKLELIKFGSWTELSDALNTGKVDGASMLIELAMKAKEQGIDLKAVALGHRDGNVVVVSKDIKTVADLKGKTFAIPHRLSTHNILLYTMLKKNNLSLSDVNVIELPPPEMPAALSEGRISGYCVAEPFGAKSVASGNGKTLYESQELWEDSVCCGLILRNDFIKNNKLAAEEFVREYINSANKAEAKDSEISSISSKFLKLEPKVLDLSLKWISYKNLKLSESDYNELSKNLLEIGLLENPPKYSDFVDTSLAEELK